MFVSGSMCVQQVLENKRYIIASSFCSTFTFMTFNVFLLLQLSFDGQLCHQAQNDQDYRVLLSEVRTLGSL